MNRRTCCACTVAVAEAISEIKAERPSFVFMAEVYWDMEYDLHQRGFDYTYNKRLYDRLEANNAPGVAAHLTADMSFQLKSVRIAMVVCARERLR